MPRVLKWLHVPLLLGACASGQAVTSTADWSYGCSPQAPLSYQIAQSAATGTLEVKVMSNSGAPMADQTVVANYTAYTGYKCPSKASIKTGPTGVARFERMRVGPYAVRVLEMGSSSTVSAQVEAETVESVTVSLQ